MLGVHYEPFSPLMKLVAGQLKVLPDSWQNDGQREQTRREHLVGLQTVFGFHPFTTLTHYRAAVHSLVELAWQADKGIVLATELLQQLRHNEVLLPSTDLIDRVCTEAITRATRRIHTALSDSLETVRRRRLDELLKRK